MDSVCACRRACDKRDKDSGRVHAVVDMKKKHGQALRRGGEGAAVCLPLNELSTARRRGGTRKDFEIDRILTVIKGSPFSPSPRFFIIFFRGR